MIITGADGALTPETEHILNILADHPDVVLATGHLSREEVDALVRRCAQLGVNRVLVTHPHFLVDASVDDMRNWQSLGALHGVYRRYLSSVLPDLLPPGRRGCRYYQIA